MGYIRFSIVVKVSFVFTKEGAQRGCWGLIMGGQGVWRGLEGLCVGLDIGDRFRDVRGGYKLCLCLNILGVARMCARLREKQTNTVLGGDCARKGGWIFGESRVLGCTWPPRRAVAPAYFSVKSSLALGRAISGARSRGRKQALGCTWAWRSVARSTVALGCAFSSDYSFYRLGSACGGLDAPAAPAFRSSVALPLAQAARRQKLAASGRALAR